MEHRIAIASLTLDPQVLPRLVEDDALVKEYTEILRLDPDAMPSPVAFDDGKKRWLADGVRRRAAHGALGKTEMLVELRKGTRAEAVWYACGANRTHGARPTNKEKIQAVENALSIPSLAERTDDDIAEQVGVERKTVLRTRAHLVPKVQDSSPRKVVRRGTEYEMDTTQIGKPKEIKDGLKQVVPDWCRDVFQEAKQIKTYQNSLNKVVKAAEALKALGSGAGSLLELQAIAGWKNEINKHVRDHSPWCVCPECLEAGKARKSCEWCRGRGWLTKPEHDRSYE